MSPALPAASGSTAARLLQAAADLLGGEVVLARRLGIQPSLLARFLAGQKELPSELLLRTVDIVLEVRESGDFAPGDRLQSTETPDT